MKKFAVLARCAGAGLLVATLFTTTPAEAATPAQEALAEVQGEAVTKNVVQNRYFYKEERFEIAPVVGMVPNNPMVRRYIGGVLLGYHFSEGLSAGGQLFYSPDMGTTDLKGLTNTLVQIAHNGDPNVQFQQPVDKMVLGATFSLNWAPVYGKINLIGQTVVNFDLYGSAGLGYLGKIEYYARYDESVAVDGSPPVRLDPEGGLKARVPVTLAIGTDFFINQTVALKIDARSYLYVDELPQYNPDEPISGNRLYNNFIATAGVSMFFPKMQPRITSF
ncbi:MAG: outer membrane beta-barrel domain-containing protein [Alphaproteobacteria bacterium]|nr:outer membrane beta-barrel domain-containing protein [Alphaproteobacteria bacterium]MCB9793277.1 outer membrane beta-barrel domain-containing protein [Alphaproteobacteria bacterium]